MSPQDRAELQRALGEGEVQSDAKRGRNLENSRGRACGRLVVEHRDRQGELIAELIEVTLVPEILASASDEIAAGARALREQITLTAAARRR